MAGFEKFCCGCSEGLDRERVETAGEKPSVGQPAPQDFHCPFHSRFCCQTGQKIGPLTTSETGLFIMYE